MARMASEHRSPPAGKAPLDSAAGEGSVSGPASKDVALIHGVSTDGRTLSIIRKRDETLQLAAAVPLEAGKPIHGEVVKLKPRPEFPLLCDVEVQVPAPEAVAGAERSPRKGPAQIASDSYRRNWDAIWSKRPLGELPN